MEKSVQQTVLVCDFSHTNDKEAERLFVKDSAGMSFTIDVCSKHKAMLTRKAGVEAEVVVDNGARWLTAREAAKLIGVMPPTVSGLARDGKIKSKAITARRSLYSRASINAYLANR